MRSFPFWFLTVFFSLLPILSAGNAQIPPTQSAKRIALVIGISDYANLSPLDNPGRDARAVARLFRKYGYIVAEHIDLDHAAFMKALAGFEELASGADEAIVFYAGHGMTALQDRQLANVIAPTDAVINCETRATQRTITMQQIVKTIQGVPKQVLLFDSCRNNPIRDCQSNALTATLEGFQPVRMVRAPARVLAPRGAGGNRGFQAMPPGRVNGKYNGRATSVLIAYSTDLGAVASDGTPGTHSPFATALLSELTGKPREPVRSILDRTAARVARATGQRPWVVTKGGEPEMCLKGRDCETSEALQQKRFTAEARQLAGKAQKAMEENRYQDALGLVLAAVNDKSAHKNQPVTPVALAALKRLMSDNPLQGILARFGEPVSSLHLFGDKYLAIRLQSKAVHVINRYTGEVVQTLPSSRYDWLKWLGDGQLAGQAWFRTARSIDLLSGNQVAGVTIRGEWQFSLPHILSPTGRLALARSTLDRQKVAVFELVKGGKLPVMDPLVVGRLAFWKDDSLLKPVFVDDDTLVFAWGGAQQGIAHWRFRTDKPIVLSALADEPACKVAKHDPVKQRDGASLSLDGKVISRVQSIDKTKRCIAMWDAGTGEKLVPFLLKDAGALHGFAVTRNLVALEKRGGYGVARLLRDRAGNQWSIRECEGTIDDVTELLPRREDWLIDPSREMSTCAAGRHVVVNTGPAFLTRPPLHADAHKVRSIQMEAASGYLWSGGDEGVLRLWRLKNIISIEPGQKLVKSSTGNDRLAGIFQNRSGEFSARVYEKDGTPVSPLVRLELLAKQDGATRDELELELWSDGQVLAVAQGFDCGFLKSCPGSVKQRLMLYHTKSGKQFWQSDELVRDFEPGGMPVVLATSPGTTEAAIRLKNGGIIIISTGTGEVRSRLAPLGKEKLWDVAFAHGSWWVMSWDGKNDPGKRTVRLHRLDASGQIEEIGSYKAQWARLFASPSGEALLVEYDTLTIEKAPVRYAIIRPSGKASSVLPKGEPFQLKAGDVMFIKAGQGGHLTAGLFTGTEQAVRSINMETGAVATLAAVQSGVVSDDARVEDPLGRAVISTSYPGKLNIMPFDRKRPLCASLAGMPADSASISADGKLLAVTTDRPAGYGLKRLVVYDLDLCVPVRSLDIEADKVIFVGSRHLWVRDRENRLRIVDLHSDPKQLLEAATSLNSRSAK